jgi:solute carrier family 25 phosphate transporter 3
MQTTRIYTPKINVVIPRMWASEGLGAFYKGLVPLWARQVPYTMMKFASFEKIVELLYAIVASGDRNSLSKGAQLAVSLCSGFMAGMLCAVISHPADTVVSKLNQRSEKGSVVAFVQSLGCRDLWKGLLQRLLFVGTLTAMQWIIYDSFKVSVGLPTTGTTRK